MIKSKLMIKNYYLKYQNEDYINEYVNILAICSQFLDSLLKLVFRHQIYQTKEFFWKSQSLQSNFFRVLMGLLQTRLNLRTYILTFIVHLSKLMPVHIIIIIFA